MAVALALLLAALAAAGCGFGPGADVGSVQLTVTREFGTEPMLRRTVEAKEADTVMRVLEANAEIATRYGGGYVKSIGGVSEEQRGGDPYDWFFFLDGVESPVGAADSSLVGGERIWWDYRDWTVTNHVPAVVGQWPAPFTAGVAGKRYPVTVECSGGGEACGMVSATLRREGVAVASGRPEKAIRILVGPWSALSRTPAGELLAAGPVESGIYARFGGAGGDQLEALDEGGEVGRRLGPGVGLVAATSRFGGAPIWLVTGGTEAAVQDAAEALDATHLRDHYAVAIEHGKAIPLPARGR
jgi:uncharacterized protein DUF4430